MEWKSNARCNQDLTEGTMFDYKGKIGICIHKIHGLGNRIYLTCTKLSIAAFGLDTDDFNIAVEKAKVIVREKLILLNDACLAFLDDESENVFVRY